MVTADSNGKKPLQTILESAYDSIVDRMVCTPVDAAGVLLSGVEGSSGNSSFGNCKILLDLGIPRVDAIRDLREAIESMFVYFMI